MGSGSVEDRPVPTTAVDSNVIIAALLSWHKYHERAFESLEALLESGEDITLPAPALVESYSAMTRLPHPHCLSLQDAFVLLDSSLRESVRVVQLTSRDMWSFLREASGEGTTGGQTYDVQTLACVVADGATRVLALNTRDFERLAPSSIEVAAP